MKILKSSLFAVFAIGMLLVALSVEAQTFSTTTPQTISPARLMGSSVQPAYSIVFVKDVEGDGAGELYRVNLDSNMAASTITKIAAETGTDISLPRVNASGELVYMKGGKICVLFSGATKPVCYSDSTAPNAICRDPHWSPDGLKLAFIQRSNEQSILMTCDKYLNPTKCKPLTDSHISLAYTDNAGVNNVMLQECKDMWHTQWGMCGTRPIVAFECLVVFNEGSYLESTSVIAGTWPLDGDVSVNVPFDCHVFPGVESSTEISAVSSSAGLSWLYTSKETGDGNIHPVHVKSRCITSGCSPSSIAGYTESYHPTASFDGLKAAYIIKPSDSQKYGLAVEDLVSGTLSQNGRIISAVGDDVRTPVFIGKDHIAYVSLISTPNAWKHAVLKIVRADGSSAPVTLVDNQSYNAIQPAVKSSYDYGSISARQIEPTNTLTKIPTSKIIDRTLIQK